MLIRIVRMTFHEEKVEEFLQLFKETSGKIREFKGCRHLALWKDYNANNVYITYSKWENADSLEAYRDSDLFQNIWSRTKILFKEKPVAFSSEEFIKVG